MIPTPRLRHLVHCVMALGLAAFLSSPGLAESDTPIPPSLTTPDQVETSIGTLKFRDGVPDQATADKVYDQLDLQRGVSAFLNGLRGVSIFAARQGIRAAGVKDNEGVLIFSGLMDSRSLFLTANADTVYFIANIDLTKGPMVIETPPGVLGLFDDLWFRWVIDFGTPGPDRGLGGKYLLLPPGYDGPRPDGGYFIGRPTTTSVALLGRAFLVNNDPKPTVEVIKKYLKIYPYVPGSYRNEHRHVPQGEGAARSAQRAKAAHLRRGHGPCHEHDPAQRLLLLRDARCSRAGAAGRGVAARDWRAVRRDRDKEGRVIQPRCAHAQDSDRRDCRGERRRTHGQLHPTRVWKASAITAPSRNG